MSCIYKITNKSNNRVYIGSTTSFENRVQSHIDDLTKGIHNNYYLQKDWNTYGSTEFNFEVIELLPNIYGESLLTKEQYYIDQYDKLTLYNIDFNILQPRVHSKKRPSLEKLLLNKDIYDETYIKWICIKFFIPIGVIKKVIKELEVNGRIIHENGYYQPTGKIINKQTNSSMSKDEERLYRLQAKGNLPNQISL
jgi:group I intron endonuclease